ESASAAKAAILSQVGQVYFGGWVSFTSALTTRIRRNGDTNYEKCSTRFAGLSQAVAPSLGAHDQRDVSHSVRTNSDENWPMSRAPSQLMGPPVRLTERGSAAVLPLFY
ncbi:hypothetical protein, partial [Ralstonia pseudosolanacearum]|uniref:hypothetical protein n=1 Tax=Ralstonia pseudosolanacearum TaxID=1310165 RepID=UPI001FF7D9B1